MSNQTDRIVSKSIDLQTVIQTIRKEAKLSQSDVAARLDISPGSYSELERNLLKSSVSRFFKLLKVLDVELVLRTRSKTEKSVVGDSK